MVDLLPQLFRQGGFVEVIVQGSLATVHGSLVFYRAAKPSVDGDEQGSACLSQAASLSPCRAICPFFA